MHHSASLSSFTLLFLMLSLGGGFWWHLSTSVAWGCCNIKVSLIINQGFRERRESWDLRVWIHCCWERGRKDHYVPSTLHSAVSKGSSPDATIAAVHQAVCSLWFSIFCSEFVAPTLSAHPISIRICRVGCFVPLFPRRHLFETVFPTVFRDSPLPT